MGAIPKASFVEAINEILLAPKVVN
jgi:hypothetical protein